MGKSANQGAKTASAHRLSRGRPWRVAAATVLVAFAALCGWQAWLMTQQTHTRELLRHAHRQTAQRMNRRLHEQQTRIHQAMNDPRVRADLAEASSSGRALAAARAMTLLPDARRVQFYAPTLDTVLGADYGDFGYAKAARLMQVKSGRMKPRIDVVREGHEHRLAMAMPVASNDGKVLAYAWVEWPMRLLEKPLQQDDVGRGRLALRRGSGREGLLLAVHGEHRALMPPDSGKSLRGSAFWVTAAMPRAPIVAPHHRVLAWMLAGLALIGAALLLWLRSRRAPVMAEEEPLLSTPKPSESTRQPSAAKAAAASPAAAPAATPVAVDPDIFRAYDIRGVVGKQLTAQVAHALGQAIGSDMHERGLPEIVIARDGRLSGPELADALADGLRATGVDVIDVGAVPTPVAYFAAFHFDCGSCVAVTGSHNPPDYNGFKVVIGGDTLSGNAIAALGERIREDKLHHGDRGNYRQVDIMADYIDRISSDVQADRPLKVVADAGNGIAGVLAPQLLEAIGCEVKPLYCEVDGQFPNHHPDPSDPENLEDLKFAVSEMEADIGVAFDGDGDRLGVVTREGEVIYPDRLLMLFARDVLARNPGATIIYDVKCTGHLQPEVLKAGGSPLMWRTGHSLIKAKMKETGAELAGEMSGHFFFRERWYGFDDGLYAACRLLEILAGDLDERSPEAIFATLPKGVSTPELKVDLREEGANHAFIERFREHADFGDARLTTIDGVRADWPDGWGLVRASNTTPTLVLRFDADSEDALERIKQRFREQLLALDDSLPLPF